MRQIGSIALIATLFLGVFAPAGPARAADYSAYFPPPLSGWTAGDVEAKQTSATLGDASYPRTRLSRLYSEPGGARVAMTVDTLDCVRAAAVERAQSDASVLGKFGEPMRLYGYGSRQALAAGRSGDAVDRIVLRVAECGIVAIGGAQTNEQILRQYLDRTPFARIEQLAAE